MEWPGMSISVIGCSFCPRPHLVEEGFFLWPRRGSSLDWALGSTYILVWAPRSVTLTITPRDSSFLPRGRKRGSRCDDSYFAPILHYSWLWDILLVYPSRVPTVSVHETHFHLGLFTRRRKSNGWRMLWKLNGIYFACNSFLEIWANWLPPGLPPISDIWGEIILLYSQTLEFCGSFRLLTLQVFPRTPSR